MAITKLSNSGIKTGGVLKYDSMLAGNAAYSPGSFESIATFALSSPAADVTFSNIPQTFTHLQLRISAQTDRSTYTTDEAWIIVNTQTSNAYHFIRIETDNNGTTMGSGGTTSTIIYGFNVASTASGTIPNFMGGGYADLLDYTSTNKYKTFRFLSGMDTNGGTGGFGGGVMIGQGTMYNNLNAITTIRVRPYLGSNFNANSNFALYGIKE